MTFALSGSTTVGSDVGVYYNTAQNAYAKFSSATFKLASGSAETISSTSFTRTIDNGSVATWNFTDVKYKIAIEPTAGGKVKFSDGDWQTSSVYQWVANGSSVSVTAAADDGYIFRRWTNGVAGVTGNANPTITVPADQARTLVAVFDSKDYISADSYIQDSLILQLDGIHNSGRDPVDGSPAPHATYRAYWSDMARGLMVTNTLSGSTDWGWSDTALYRTARRNDVRPRVVDFVLDWTKEKTFEAYLVKSDTSTSAKLAYFQNVSPFTNAEDFQITAANAVSFAHLGATTLSQTLSAAFSGSIVATVRRDEIELYSTPMGVTTSTYETPEGVETNDLLIGTSGSNDSDLIGSYHAFRVYDKALTEHERRWNEAVDAHRFTGGGGTAAQVSFYVWPLDSEFGLTSTPALDSTTSVASGSSQAFSLSGLSAHPDDAALANEYKTGCRARFYGWQVDNGGPSTSAHHSEVTGDAASASATVRSLHSALTWDVRREYQASVAATQGGKVSFDDGLSSTSNVTWRTAGSSVTFHAVANVGCTFSHWEGPLEGLSATPFDPDITLVLDRPRALRAVFVDPERTPVTTTWIKANNTTGNWRDDANWDNGAPLPGDSVIIRNTQKATVIVDSPTPVLASLILANANGSSSYPQTLTATNWYTCIRAKSITVGIGGVIDCKPCTTTETMSNRVWLAGETLSVAATGMILADGCGYTRTYGGCWSQPGVYCHYERAGLYGGWWGGVHCDSDGPRPYGSIEEPTDPGSGCGSSGNVSFGNGNGGGAIFLDFTGAVTVDGKITADVKSKGYRYGSGGSVLINCKTISGSGSVTANGIPSSNPDAESVAGGGGRIAVHYESAAQSNVECRVVFEAAGGVGLDATYYSWTGNNKYGKDDERDWEEGVGVFGPGSLWFPDNQFLDSSESYSEIGWPFVGQWYSGTGLAAIHWKGDRVFQNTRLWFPDCRSAVIDGNLEQYGNGKYSRFRFGLVFTNADVTVNGNVNLHGSRLETYGRKLKVTGDVDIDVSSTGGNYYGGEVAVHATPTNAPDCYGAELEVGGKVHVAGYSVLAPFCERNNGAVVKMKMRNLTVDASGKVNADQKGWGWGKGPGAPSTAKSPGASYGGKGGYAKDMQTASSQRPTYGDADMPVYPGSGDYVYPGGGCVLLEVERHLVLNGTITANGNLYSKTYYANNAGGSGGTVNVRAMELTGGGLIEARGGITGYGANNSNGGAGGGGGRVAIFTRKFDETFVKSFTNDTSHVNVSGGGLYYPMSWNGTAEKGTIRWTKLPPGGYFITIRSR